MSLWSAWLRTKKKVSSQEKLLERGCEIRVMWGRGTRACSGQFFVHSDTVSSCRGEQDISLIRPEVPYTLR